MLCGATIKETAEDVQNPHIPEGINHAIPAVFVPKIVCYCDIVSARNDHAMVLPVKCIA